ncbi:MAG: phytoene desaturase family protein [Candidatus Omnitrophica bacterium]|nr:phytoene desaturase family protein [Candidatus Omnitrophota bacterium]MCM8826287.1 phytoene desaturase family protein [Candidatus Omnitrophota bacterium]
MPEKIAIIGAGVGGLSTAIRLAYNGYNVEVLEKLSQCGGRNNLLEDKGFKFDMGPSFVLMPDFFYEIFNYCHKNINDYLDLEIIDPSYIIFYPDGRKLTVYKDTDKTKDELERFEKNADIKFEAFIKETARLYNTIKPLLYNCFSTKDILNPTYWPLLGKIRVLDSYWKLAKKFFKSEELLYALTFEAMFMGVSPFDAPALYSIISYADHIQKIFHPMGGMYTIPKALENIAKELKVKFIFNTEVKNITKRNNEIILEANNWQEKFDRLIINADYAYSQETLLRRNLPNYKYSCSVYLLYLGLKEKIEGLAHHNLFFSSNLRENLNDIFNKKETPHDPSFYVHVPTFTDSSLAPKNKEILYILIPVANLEKNPTNFSEREYYLRKIVFEKINRIIGKNLENLIEVEHRFYPHDFIQRYNIKYGATFGLSHNLTQSAFFRPTNFDRKIKNIYYVGASTQPGGGLPPVIASSKIVTDLILKSQR